MTEGTRVTELRQPVSFTIDGEPYRVEARRQRAVDLLRLAGRDPASFDLAKLTGGGDRRTQRYNDNDSLTVHEGDRFVSIRQSAPVA